jgi:hypothetical protein
MTLMPRRIGRSLLAVSGFAIALVLAGAANAAGAAKPTSGDDRLFQMFAEDATIVPNQWWEGSFDFTSYDTGHENFDVTALMLTAALKPVDRLELGGRVGFGNSSGDPGAPDGSGATDLDLWGKWHLGSTGGRAEFAVGGLATIPTGDETAGLGHDAFDFEGFGAMRYRLPAAILCAHAGFRINGDGHIGEPHRYGATLDGKTSFLLGAGAIFPLSDQVSLVGEANMETERWEGVDSDVRLLFGVNWRPLNRGMIRAAVSAGLTDGAPDGRLILGYAYTF